MTDVFVVDRYELARRGLVDLIEKSGDLRVVGETSDATAALAAVSAAVPDVVVIDVRAGYGEGIELCRAIGDTVGAQCLMLADEALDDLWFAAIRAGASGFLLDHASGETVLNAIRSVAAGHSVLDVALTDRVFAQLRLVDEPAPAKRQALTAQERRVLTYVGAGMTNLQIARRCDISEKTVKNHVTSILRKLNVSSRTQAALYLRDGAEPELR
jgi:DNA-binding NarL/FixJ family response regulator